MNKDQPNEDQKINARADDIAQPTEQKKNQQVSHILNQPQPEIVEACLQSKNGKRTTSQKKQKKDVVSIQDAKKKKKEDTLGAIYQSMEKLGNAICLKNGLYQKTDLKDKGKARKGLRLGHLKRKNKGKDSQLQN